MWIREADRKTEGRNSLDHVMSTQDEVIQMFGGYIADRLYVLAFLDIQNLKLIALL